MQDISMHRSKIIHEGFRHVRVVRFAFSAAVLTLVGLLMGAQPVFATNSPSACDGTANDPDTCTGRTTGNGNVCIGDLSGFGTGINCTANDVSVGFADNVRDPGSGSPITSCVAGSTLNFKADFHVGTSGGVTRYDLGLYFATDGDPNHDGAKTGGCAVSKETAANNSNGTFINLDPAPDTCGDIDVNHKPQVVTLTLSALCTQSTLFFNPATGRCQATEPFPGAAHCMSLPNAVSWRQQGANQVCDSPLDAFPGTTAKCNVNPAFGLPVIVETATITVVKDASPTQVPETGGTVHYTVTATNSASFVTLTIDSIMDDLYGNLGDANNSAVTNNTCPGLIGTTLQPGGSANCGFDAFVTGNFGHDVIDTAEVCGHDSAGHTGLCGHDDASVTITDVKNAPTLDKSALSFTADVTYQVVVTNTSAIDTLTLNHLCDNKFGDITGASDSACGAGPFETVVSTTCATGGTIAVSGNYTCTFVGRITSSPHTNTLQGTATDSDGVTYDQNSTPAFNPDSATVTVTFQ